MAPKTRLSKPTLLPSYSPPRSTRKEVSILRKRKSDALDEPEKTLPDMADTFRKRLVATKRFNNSNLRKQPTIDLDSMDPIAATSPFFEKLPREIRDKIYGLVWDDTHGIIQRYERKYYAVTYGHRDPPNRRTASKAPWLLTSKQLLLEGCSAFVKQGVWHFSPHEVGPLEPSQYIFPLITPGMVRAHHLHLGSESDGYYPFCGRYSYQEGYEKHEGEVDDGTAQQYHWLPKASITPINAMAASMEFSTTVKEVKVDIKVYNIAMQLEYGGVLQYPNAYEFDLSQLERLAVHRGLQSFKAKLVVRVTPGRRPASISDTDTMKLALMDELERIGTLLVEGGSVVRVNSLNPNNSNWQNWDMSLSVGRPAE
ncbi:hypothetical protein N0V83_001362 [Neocucurbitaria cava]|uniref:Uncharacterized protein n=1 Tax=Neocucurbitaria cava TaxID=798079 RepID=A0A9W8YHR1_9PLEO|nr:hypothetical protein N0V83_001362 [Neocucurbitaria cava]